VRVRFRAEHAPYRAGAVAELPVEVSRRLAREGIVEQLPELAPPRTVPAPGAEVDRSVSEPGADRAHRGGPRSGRSTGR
jgi:hypothetical protein